MRETIRKNSKLILISLTGVSVLAMVWVVFGARQTINQPISYNHKLHIEKAELNCVDCHKFVETMASATIPNIDVCSDCHSGEPLSDSPEELMLLKYIEAGEKIPWQKIYTVPAHVYFSHRRHVTIGEIECLKCHKEKKVTYDCLACHR